MKREGNTKQKKSKVQASRGLSFLYSKIKIQFTLAPTIPHKNSN